MIKLNKDERILCVIPEYASGPGWSSRVLWIYIINSRKEVRLEAFQWDELNLELQDLFEIGAVVHKRLVNAIERICAKEAKG